METMSKEARANLGRGIAWKSHSTSVVRLRSDKFQLMEDIVSACMAASLEDPAMIDYEQARFFKRVTRDAEGKRTGVEMVQRTGADDWDAEKLFERALVKHIDRACRVEVAFQLNRQPVPAVWTGAKPLYTAVNKAHDAYLNGAGTEMDRFDKLVAKACELLPAVQGEWFRKLAYGNCKLSDISPSFRGNIGLTARYLLHMRV